MGGFTLKTFTTPGVRTINYWQYIPKLSDAKTYKNIPLIIYLHGSGERGDNPNKVAGVSLPKYLKNGNIKPNAIVIAPQIPGDESKEGWRINEVYNLIQSVLNEFDIDEKKIAITGHSLGGVGALQLAQKYPDLFSVCVPISYAREGMGILTEKLNCRVRFIFESSISQDMRKCKNAVDNYINSAKNNYGSKFAELYTNETINGTNHSSVANVYGETDLVEWMLSFTND